MRCNKGVFIYILKGGFKLKKDSEYNSIFSAIVFYGILLISIGLFTWFGVSHGNDVLEDGTINNDRFEIVSEQVMSSGVTSNVFVDKETGVLYLVIYRGSTSSVEVMVDKNGIPLTL